MNPITKATILVLCASILASICNAQTVKEFKRMYRYQITMGGIELGTGAGCIGLGVFYKFKGEDYTKQARINFACGAGLMIIGIYSTMKGRKNKRKYENRPKYLDYMSVNPTGFVISF